MDRDTPALHGKVLYSVHRCENHYHVYCGPDAILTQTEQQAGRDPHDGMSYKEALAECTRMNQTLLN